MPVFTIDAPNGDSYEIEAPEGATKEQAFEFFKKEHAAGNVKPKAKKSSFRIGGLDDLVEGAKGTAAFVGDVASGLVKLPAQAALAVGGKLANPSQSLQTSWESAQQTVEDTFPSFGNNVSEDNLGYEAPMYPFQKYGEGVEYVAKKAGALTGSKDVEGAINIGGNFLPIPGVGLVKKLSKSKVKPSSTVKDLSAISNDIDVAKHGTVPEAKIPDVLYTDQSGVARPSLPDAGELASRQQQEALRQQKYAGQMELPLETSPQAISEMQNRGSPQLDMFAPRNEPTGRLPVPNEERVPNYGSQDSLPFQTSFEDIANTQRAGDAQMDMFTGNTTDAPYNAQEVWHRDMSAQAEAVRKQQEALETYKAQQQRQSEAQRVLEERQRAMEQEVAQRTSLEMNAAERARREQAPTGYEQWREGMRNDALRPRDSGPGPIEFTKSDGPGFADAPYQHDGLDFSQYLAEKGSYPIVKQGEIRDAYALREKERAQEHIRANVLDDKQIDFENRMQRVEETLRNQAHESPDQAQLRLEKGRPTSEGVKKFYGPRSQRGSQSMFTDIGLAALSGLKKLANMSPTDPAVLAAKASAQAAAKQERVKAILGSNSGYLENVTTPETVLALAPTAKDIPKSASVGGKSVTPGVNALAVKHPNPLVKYMRAKTREVFVTADRFTEQYITGQEGIGKTIRSMSGQEKAEVVQLLQLGDKKQAYITPEIMDKHGFSEAQKEFVKKFYEMDQKKLDVWNENLEKAGKPIVEERAGHMPGIFKGDYKQLVLGKDGKPIGVIAVDFKWQLKAAQKAMSKKFPDAQYTPFKRSSLGGSSGRSGEFGAMQEVLTMLAEKDPSFKEVQTLIEQAIANHSDAAYGAAQHALKKKGVVGAEGAKPWKDAEANANDFIKAYLEHWEDQMISHLALPVEQNVRALMDNPALKDMPNAKDYVDTYLHNMTGRNVGDTGKSLNVILDAPFRAMGLGPNATRAVVGQFNKRMGQYSMGFGNYLFAITQWLQVVQTGGLELSMAAHSFGINRANIPSAMTKAIKDWTSMGVGESKPEFKAMLEEAKNRGLLTFSEFSDVNKITQNKYSAMADKVIDYNRSELGEKPTRPLVFFTAVNMLKNTGLEGKALYDAAYNITQDGMFDYRPNERPMMYQRMGVVGQLGGSLQTYKHAYLNQLQRAITNAHKDPVSAAYAALGVVAYSGLVGVPFYQEADSIFQKLSESMGKRQTIAEYIVAKLPELTSKGAISELVGIDIPKHLAHGSISVGSGVNMQSRLSAADVLPNSPVEAVSPYFSTLGRMGQAVGDVYSNNDALAWSNLGVQATPQGPLKGLAEKALLTDGDGYVLNREGLRGNERSQFDKNVRTFSGGRSLNEALTGENQYLSGQRLKGYRDTQKSILEGVKRKYVQGTLTTEDTQAAVKKFTETKGDPEQFVNELVKYAQSAKLDKQKRLQGVPNGSLSSLYKYQEYADDVAK